MSRMSFLNRSSRRQFLQAVAGGAVAIRAFGQQPAPGITSTKLADNFTLLSGAGGNVLVFKSRKAP